MKSFSRTTAGLVLAFAAIVGMGATRQYINSIRDVPGVSVGSPADGSPLVYNGSSGTFESPSIWWDDLVTPGLSLRGNASTDPAVMPVALNNVIYGTGFDAGEAGFASLQLPHGLASLSDDFPDLYIQPHFHASLSANTSAGQTNSVWRMDYEWATIGGEYTSGSLQVTNGFTTTSTNVHQVVPLGSITNNSASGTLSSIIRFKLSRVSFDTQAVPNGTEIIVDSIDFHVPRSRLGSTNPFSD